MIAGAMGEHRGLGRAEAGCQALEDSSCKEGEPEGSGAEPAGNRRPYCYHCQLFKSVMHKTSGGYWTCSDEFCEYPLPEKLHFHIAVEEVRVKELLSY